MQVSPSDGRANPSLANSRRPLPVPALPVVDGFEKLVRSSEHVGRTSTGKAPPRPAVFIDRHADLLISPNVSRSELPIADAAFGVAHLAKIQVAAAGESQPGDKPCSRSSPVVAGGAEGPMSLALKVGAGHSAYPTRKSHETAPWATAGGAWGHDNAPTPARAAVAGDHRPSQSQGYPSGATPEHTGQRTGHRPARQGLTLLPATDRGGRCESQPPCEVELGPAPHLPLAS